jgi:YfiH family protein
MMVFTEAPLSVEPFEDTAFLSFPSLREVAGFAHCFTTKPWNMAPHRGPEADLAVARRRRVCEFLRLPFGHLTAADQVHSAHVLRISGSDVGRGRQCRADAMHFVDGMVSELAGVPLVQFSADCPLVVAVEPRRRIFGTAHASWRGTVAGIAVEMIRQLVREFGINPIELIAGVGPCAGRNEYEVGEEVFRVANARLHEAERFFSLVRGKRCFDLKSANAAQLIEAGLRADRISIAAESTISDARFYSHRREGEGTGRFALFAGFRVA